MLPPAFSFSPAGGKKEREKSQLLDYYSTFLSGNGQWSWFRRVKKRLESLVLNSKVAVTDSFTSGKEGKNPHLLKMKRGKFQK